MRYILFVFLFLFAGCSTKNYEHTQTKIIIIKSPKLKFADVGYIRNSGKSVQMELFVAGQAIEKFTINHLVCTSEGCMSKEGFNKEYLSAYYPDDILQHIVLAQEIYDGKNKQKTPSGFTQKIKDDHVDIEYKVQTKSIYFKDKKNNILLKIKDTQ